MMIGIGTDLLEIARVERLYERFGMRLLERCLTAAERDAFHASAHPVSFLAKRIAAKEALTKALGTGFAQGVSWQDICVTRESSGRPTAHFSGQAAAIYDSLCAGGMEQRIHLSLTDTATHAQAFAVLESRPI